MAETFEAYRTRVLSYLGDEEPIGVQQATPSQLDRRLRDVVPEELIRRPAPEEWSIAEIVAHLADAELANICMWNAATEEQTNQCNSLSLLRETATCFRPYTCPRDAMCEGSFLSEDG